MVEYLIRKKNNLDVEISKFEQDKEPLGVYTVSSRGCTCPAAWRRKLVSIQEWLTFGQINLTLR